MQKSNKTVAIQTIVLLCYLSMSILYTIGKLGWKSYTAEVMPMDWLAEVKQLLQCLFAGVILYALPYEQLLYGARNLFARALWLEEGDDVIQWAFQVLLPLVLYTCLSVIIGGRIESYPLDGRYDLVVLWLTLLLVVLLMGLLKSIENEGVYTGCFLLLLCFHAVVITRISGKYVLAEVIIVALLCTWFLTCFLEKKINVKAVLAAVIVLPLFFLKLAEWTGRELQLFLLLNKHSLCNGRWYLLLKEMGKVKDLSTYKDYAFTMMYDTHGTGSIILFFCFFLLLSIASLYGVRKMFLVLKRRAIIVLLIYMIFTCTIAFGLLQELGVLPSSALRIMKNEYNIPMMFLAFRMFDIREIKPICPPEYIDWDEDF